MSWIIASVGDVVHHIGAAGMKSKAVIGALLSRSPVADRDTIRALGRKCRLKGLKPLIRETDRG
jgi:hypothetical protein